MACACKEKLAALEARVRALEPQKEVTDVSEEDWQAQRTTRYWGGLDEWPPPAGDDSWHMPPE